MGKENVSETALELVKSENVQNKAAELLGMLFPYAGIRKKAVDMYIEEIEKSNLSMDAKMISLFNAKKKLKKLKNQKDIVEVAIANAKEETDFSEESGVDEEWFDRFMESASFVSSEEMQMVWGKILANEFEKPRSTPPNMTRILSEFTQMYAKAFRTICSMQILLVFLGEKDEVIEIERRVAVVFNKNEEYMHELGLSFEILNELETLGVIKFDAVSGYAATYAGVRKVLVYIDGDVMETNSYRKDFPFGNVLLTSAGETLRRITESYSVEGYDDAVKKYLEDNGVLIKSESSYNVNIFGDSVQVAKKL